MTARGPRRSMSRPRNGLSNAETRKPNENAPAVTPRGQPNSSRIGGNRSENAVRAFTPTPIVTNAIATIDQPKNGRRTVSSDVILLYYPLLLLQEASDAGRHRRADRRRAGSGRCDRSLHPTLRAERSPSRRVERIRVQERGPADRHRPHRASAADRS